MGEKEPTMSSSRLFIDRAFLLIALSALPALPLGAEGQANPVPSERAPLIASVYAADPSVHVFGDRLYIYPSHDIPNDVPSNDQGDQYDMKDYCVFSLGGFDSPAVDHGVALDIKDVPWASRQMWAPDAARKAGKYYLYFPAKDKEGVFRIGAAVGDSPTGPFVAAAKPIPGSFSIDPAVFVDDDGSAYMYFGGLMGGQLERWRSGEYEPNGTGPDGSESAPGPRVARMSADMLSFDGSPAEVAILDEYGKPVLVRQHMKRFFEASWMHKYKGNYYLSYSTGDTHYIAYAIGTSPLGPFTYRGRILNPVRGWTTHHSIVEYRGKWYLFYHDDSVSGQDHLRTVKYQELKHNDDGSIRTLMP
jgi:hypothetical protein